MLKPFRPGGYKIPHQLFQKAYARYVRASIILEAVGLTLLRGSRMSSLMAVKVQKSQQEVLSLRAAEPVRRMNRDFQIRFTAILLALLTTAAVVYAGYNLQTERQFQVPDDGVWWVEHQGRLTADRVQFRGRAPGLGSKLATNLPRSTSTQ